MMGGKDDESARWVWGRVGLAMGCLDAYLDCLLENGIGNDF